MFKFKISEISDGLFILGSAFLIAFVTGYYFLKNNVTAILISTPCSIILFCVYMLFLKKKKGKLLIKREDEEKYVKCANALCLENKEFGENVVFSTLASLGKNPVKVTNGIVCENDFYYVKFSYDKITAGNLANAYKKTPKSKNLVFIAITFSDDALAFASGFFTRIKLLTLSEIFPFLQKANTLPNGGFIPKEQKTSFLNLLKQTFQRQKAKTFALYGSFLLIMSRFVFFPTWYVICGSIFLIYAITIKFFAPKPAYKSFFD
ncbi:MAG: hypothetical protein IJW64_01320 [Clostridia bacterium]|nr:hypothetical protein [Clostridia bacterium]